MVWGLANPSGEGSWDELKQLFHPEFRVFVDELLSPKENGRIIPW